MKNRFSFTVMFLLMSLTVFACGVLAPTETVPQGEAEASTEPNSDPATAAPISTMIPASSPTPTAAPLQLEIIQYQTWTDRDGNVRVNILFRNPYDFPVAPTSGSGVSLLNKAGEFIRADDLYYLDGISGGGGFILPGETIAATACFTCEQAPLPEEWDSVSIKPIIKEASGLWNTYTDVETTLSDVSFDGDSPIFWVTGTVKNNTDVAMSRISARIFVFDQDGNLVGAAEVSAWDVGPGATADFNGYGIGLKPEGTVKTEVSALGVNY